MARRNEAAAASPPCAAPLTLDGAGLEPWCRPCRARSPPLSAPPSSFLSPPPPPPPPPRALEFRLILPPPSSSASSPQAGRRLHKPKHKHTSPTAAATSAARRRSRRHVAARSEIRSTSLPVSARPPVPSAPPALVLASHPEPAAGAGLVSCDSAICLPALPYFILGCNHALASAIVI